MDPKSLGLGAIFGGMMWELFKQIISSTFKIIQTHSEQRNRLIREDIEVLIKFVCEILELSINYYALDFNSEKAKETSRQIKAKAKTAGMKLNTINTQLTSIGKEKIEIKMWTSFKYAATNNLDVLRQDIWSEDDPRLTEIYKAANILHISLNRARYSSI
jgi:hypothetical protein